ncbi:MAG: glycosyltransferase family 4 protein, partial [Solirubrobacterales bacterium]
AERSLLAQAAFDATDGAAVVIATPPGPLAMRAREVGLRTVEGPGFEQSFRVAPTRLPLVAFGLLAAGWRLARLARDNRATVVHANSIRAGLIGGAARLFGGPPVITHVRDCMPESRIADATRAAARLGSSEIVANSRYTADSFGPTRAGIPPAVIYNAIDGPLMRDLSADQLTSSPATDAAGVVLAVIGQITPWKGQDTAIRALAQLKSRLPAARLVIAGSVKFADAGSHDNRAYELSLHKLADELGVAEDVEFCGELADVAELLRTADIVLMPSWEEPFGRVAVEAMAAGRAVIATSVGGPGEFIEHRTNGMLADPRRLDQWVDAIHELATDSALRDALGSRARRDVTRRFSAGSDETRMLSIYRRVGNKQPGRTLMSAR